MSSTAVNTSCLSIRKISRWWCWGKYLVFVMWMIRIT